MRREQRVGHVTGDRVMARGLRIAAHALRQLGAELITSDDVAFDELIKTAFDARSPRVTVNINASVDVHALEVIEQRLASDQMAHEEAKERVAKSASPELSADERNQILRQTDRAARKDSPEFPGYLAHLRLDQSIAIIDNVDTRETHQKIISLTTKPIKMRALHNATILSTLCPLSTTLACRVG